METISACILVACLGLVQNNSFAQFNDSHERAGYGTGNGWKNTSSLLKEPLVQGLIDGYLAANYLNDPKGDTEWLTSCLKGMKVDQIVAIFDKYLADHPEEWHKPMSLIAHSALRKVCKK